MHLYVKQGRCSLSEWEKITKQAFINSFLNPLNMGRGGKKTSPIFALCQDFSHLHNCPTVNDVNQFLISDEKIAEQQYTRSANSSLNRKKSHIKSLLE